MSHKLSLDSSGSSGNNRCEARRRGIIGWIFSFAPERFAMKVNGVRIKADAPRHAVET